MRINQYLARCGLGSRRAVEELILAYKVKLNGETVASLGVQVEESDRVEVEGRRVHPPQESVYLMLNKPRGYDVTRGGRHHHRRAYDLLPPGTHPAVQSVGRLDRESTGLLLFTNDGDLAYRLMHPKFECEKIYEVEVEGEADAMKVQRLLEGVELEDGPARAARVDRLERLESATPGAAHDRLRIVMQIGRNRIVRRMCEVVGLPVVTLNRTAIGPLRLGELRRGKSRPLTAFEIRQLRNLAGLKPAQALHEPHSATHGGRPGAMPRKIISGVLPPEGPPRGMERTESGYFRPTKPEKPASAPKKPVARGRRGGPKQKP